jgi:release factor glutamine methyltransferase
MTCREAFRDLQTTLTPRYGKGEARSIARIVLEDVFRFFQGADRLMGDGEVDHFEKIKSRLLEGEPVQYVLGQADFYGFKFLVNPHVLIPRQETEELVYWIHHTIKKEFPGQKLQLLDIGTGTGCIPITLRKINPQLSVAALDVSKQALEVSRENARRLEVSVTFYQIDILREATWAHLPVYDLIVSNPPYIPKKERPLMDPHVLEHEPPLALFVEDEDPLLFYKTITLFAKKHLKKGGYLFFETNAFNAKEVGAFMEKNGFTFIRIEKDLHGKDRMIRGKTQT